MEQYCNIIFNDLATVFYCIILFRIIFKEHKEPHHSLTLLTSLQERLELQPETQLHAEEYHSFIHKPQQDKVCVVLCSFLCCACLLLVHTVTFPYNLLGHLV